MNPGSEVRKFLKRLKLILWRIRTSPKAFRLFRQVLENNIYHFRRYYKWSGVKRKYETQNQLRAVITKDYHKLEKGLSLKAPRVGFGQQAVRRLVSNVRQYDERYGRDETAQVAVNVLTAYYEFNLAHDLEDQDLYQTLTALKNGDHSNGAFTCDGGVEPVTKEQIHEAAVRDLRPFFASRHSIRQFASDEVDISLIEQAVTMAQSTPSVCNRQPWKVHIIENEAVRQKALELQGGNRGFGDQASKVLIITTEMGSYLWPGELNQCWVSGGMFAMSLVYALHSLGLGTCCLNWCLNYRTDQELKKLVGMDDSEATIMLLAVGHLPDRLNVAQSHRRNRQDMLVTH